MKKRKFLFVLTSCFLVGALVGCAKGTAKEEDNPTVDPGGDDPVTPTPTEVSYSVKIGNQTTKLTKGNGQYTATLSNLVKDASVTFYQDDKAITNAIVGEVVTGANNLIQGTVPNFYIHNDAASSTLTFKVNGNAYTFFATGYGDEPGPVTVTYTVSVGSANYTLQQDTSASMADGQTGQYVASLNNVKKDEVVVFAKDSQAITQNIGGEPESATSKNLIQGEVGNFTIHNDASTSTLYLKTWFDGGYSFWATGYEEGEEPPEPIGVTYSIVVGDGANIVLSKDDSAVLAKDQTGQYTANLYDVKKDAAVTFYADGIAITDKIGSDPEDEDNKNLIQGSVGSFIIHNDADLSTLYFKTWSDGGMSFWATGYEKGEEPEPVGVVYTIKVGEATPVTLVKDDSATLIEGQTGQYVGKVSTVSKSEAVVFYADDVAISNIGSEPEDEENKNLIQTNEGGFYIHNDALESTIYFKTWSDGGYSFWATGYEKGEEPEPPVTEINYYIAGSIKEAAWSDTAVKLEEHTYEGEDTTVIKEYYAQVEFGEGDIWLIKNDKATPDYYKLLEPGVTGMHNDSEDNNNIVIDDAGTYDVYFKLYSEDSGKSPTIWAKAQGEEPEPPEPPVEVAYTIQVGEEEPVALVKNETASLEEGQLAQYEATLTTLGEGEAVVFYADGVAITDKIGSDTEDEENKNLIQGSVGSFIIHNDADSSTIYFKTWSDGGMSFWATGYEKGEEPVPVEPVYTIKIGEGTPVTLVKNETAILAENQKAQYEATITELKKDAAVTFYADEVGIDTGIGSDPEDEENKNLIQGSAGSFVIHNDAESSTIYFKTWTDGGYSFWATGYQAEVEPEPEPPVTAIDYYVGGALGGEEWNNKAVKLSEHTYEGGDERVVKEFHAEVTFAKDDQWKIVSDEETPAYYNGLEDGVTGMHIATEGDDNIIIDDAGTYDIYFKLYSEESLQAPTIWAKAQGDDPEPVTQGFYLVGDFNEWQAVEDGGYAMELNGDSETEYVIKDVEIDAEEEFKVYNSGDYYGFETVKDGCKGLVTGLENGNIKMNESGTYDIYFDTVEGNQHGMWIAKHSEPQPEELRTFYLDPGCWDVDGAWYAAYAFGGSEEATWFKMDKVGDYYTVEIDASKYAKVIFCRMNPASEEMNWDNRWNQTSDLTIGEDNLYTITAWGEGTHICPGAWSTLEE